MNGTPKHIVDDLCTKASDETFAIMARLFSLVEDDPGAKGAIAASIAKTSATILIVFVLKTFEHDPVSAEAEISRLMNALRKGSDMSAKAVIKG